VKYVQYLNSLIKQQVKDRPNLVVFGQNVNAGSSLSGLTRGLSMQNSSLLINTQNSENSLVGIGFGLMLNGVSSIFFMKQMDFLLLGVDHLVNTYNIVRQKNTSSSFTIFPITVDSGYEGPQSALNNLDDFCSIAGVDGYSFTNKEDSESIISNELIKPGFRILSPGQRLLREDVLTLDVLHQHNNKYFQYYKGDDISIVCFNNSLSYGVEFHNIMLNRGLTSSVFSINCHLYTNFDHVINDINKTKRLLIIDDSKSRNRLSDRFLIEVLAKNASTKYKMIVRQPTVSDFYPQKDSLDINYNSAIDDIFNQ